MAYIFLDESGDLGFKPQSSKWFIFTIVLINDHKKIEKVIKNIRKGLKKKYRFKLAFDTYAFSGCNNYVTDWLYYDNEK